MEQRSRDSKEESMESKRENVDNIEAETENTDNRAERNTDSTADIDGKDSVDDRAKKKPDNEENKENTGDQTIDKDIITESTQEKGEQTKVKEEIVSDRTNRKESSGDGEQINKKTGKKKKILIPVGIFFVLIAVCCCAYSIVAFSYKDKFLPETYINGIDCSELDGAQVAGLLENQLQTYHLDITGRDHASGASDTLIGQVTAGDIQLTYGGNARRSVDALLAEQNVFTWLYRKFSNNIYSTNLSQDVSYDAEQLKSIVNGWEACRPENMIVPQNAFISQYSEKLQAYEIIPEVEGTKFDVQRLLELMDVAILSHETSLDLEAEGCYEEPTVRQNAVELTEAVEKVNKWLSANITYDWNGAEIIIDTELLKDWITMGKDGPVLNEAAVAEFVEEQAEENDTYGKRRSFMTTLGVELSLPSGYYGWLTDKEAETEELIEAICQGKTVSREPVYASTARQKGMSDIGNSYVEVDLTHQHLYLYEGGTIIFETDFVSGSMSATPDCVTPEGVFGISYKTTNAVLRGADYETPVNYWMPFYGNYGLHDATWRSEFGGQIYITDGSHGCVNLPLSSAATIYEHMSTGFPVICYYYQVDPLAEQPAEENWDDNDEEE